MKINIRWVFDGIDWIIFGIKDCFNQFFNMGIYKPELLWSVRFECGCDGVWSYCPDWKSKCSVHNKKVIEIKAHSSYNNVWEYLFGRMEEYPKGIILEEREKCQ